MNMAGCIATAHMLYSSDFLPPFLLLELLFLHFRALPSLLPATRANLKKRHTSILWCYFSHAFLPLVFAYCKQSKTGGGMGMRLAISASFPGPCPPFHYLTVWWQKVILSFPGSLSLSSTKCLGTRLAKWGPGKQLTAVTQLKGYCHRLHIPYSTHQRCVSRYKNQWSALYVVALVSLWLLTVFFLKRRLCVTNLSSENNECSGRH